VGRPQRLNWNSGRCSAVPRALHCISGVLNTHRSLNSSPSNSIHPGRPTGAVISPPCHCAALQTVLLLFTQRLSDRFAAVAKPFDVWRLLAANDAAIARVLYIMNAGRSGRRLSVNKTGWDFITLTWEQERDHLNDGHTAPPKRKPPGIKTLSYCNFLFPFVLLLCC